MRVERPGTDNRGALVWLERALEHTRTRGQKRLENLLECVKAEVILEIRLSAGMSGDRPSSNGETDTR